MKKELSEAFGIFGGFCLLAITIGVIVYFLQAQAFEHRYEMQQLQQGPEKP